MVKSAIHFPLDSKKRASRMRTLLRNATADRSSLEAMFLGTMNNKRASVVEKQVALDALASIEGGKGIVHALGGDAAAASRSFDEAFRRRLWSMRFNGEPNVRGSLLCEAIVRAQGEAMLLERLDDAMAKVDAAERQGSLYSFPRWVASMARGFDPSASLLPKDLYGDVSQDENRDGTLVERICDWHITVGTSDGSWLPPFLTDPYSMLPIEVFAWNRVRSRAGLPELEGEHPLMRSKVCHVPLGVVEPLPHDHPFLVEFACQCQTDDPDQYRWATSVQP